MLKHLVSQVELTLLPQKAIYIEVYRMLLLADVHLGKATHFQKSGVAIPASIGQKMIEEIDLLVSITNPQQVIFLGDLFHSHLNREWEYLTKLTNGWPGVKFILIEGNHDILPQKAYCEAGLDVLPQLQAGPFVLTHHPEDVDGFNLCGHLHPGITISGKGKQRLRLPAFWFGKNRCVMPAFGNFTGLSSIKPAKTDVLFAIANEQIFKL